jgi:anti-sigma regulatory factor (Ser/Thr protein kinase)
MIVLSAIDAESNRARFESIEMRSSLNEPTLEAMRHLARELGLGEIEFTDSPFSTAHAHRWLILDGKLCYYASFAQARQSIDAFTRYLGVALCTAAAADFEPLRRLHIALHELGANSLEHGSPIRPKPSLQLELAFAAGSIEGLLCDDCLPFNPLNAAPLAIHERVAVRARRGYGIALARRLLDELEYGYRDGHNELRFRQRTL